jgi:hypothetical protein
MIVIAGFTALTFTRHKYRVCSQHGTVDVSMPETTMTETVNSEQDIPNHCSQPAFSADVVRHLGTLFESPSAHRGYGGLETSKITPGSNQYLP